MVDSFIIDASVSKSDDRQRRFNGRLAGMVDCK